MTEEQQIRAQMTIAQVMGATAFHGGEGVGPAPSAPITTTASSHAAPPAIHPPVPTPDAVPPALLDELHEPTPPSHATSTASSSLAVAHASPSLHEPASGISPLVMAPASHVADPSAHPPPPSILDSPPSTAAQAPPGVHPSLLTTGSPGLPPGLLDEEPHPPPLSAPMASSSTAAHSPPGALPPLPGELPDRLADHFAFQVPSGDPQDSAEAEKWRKRNYAGRMELKHSVNQLSLVHQQLQAAFPDHKVLARVYVDNGGDFRSHPGMSSWGYRKNYNESGGQVAEEEVTEATRQRVTATAQQHMGYGHDVRASGSPAAPPAAFGGPGAFPRGRVPSLLARGPATGFTGGRPPFGPAKGGPSALRSGSPPIPRGPMPRGPLPKPSSMAASSTASSAPAPPSGQPAGTLTDSPFVSLTGDLGKLLTVDSPFNIQGKDAALSAAKDGPAMGYSERIDALQYGRSPGQDTVARINMAKAHQKREEAEEALRGGDTAGHAARMKEVQDLEGSVVHEGNKIGFFLVPPGDRRHFSARAMRQTDENECCHLEDEHLLYAPDIDLSSYHLHSMDNPLPEIMKRHGLREAFRTLSSEAPKREETTSTASSGPALVPRRSHSVLDPTEAMPMPSPVLRAPRGGDPRGMPPMGRTGGRPPVPRLLPSRGPANSSSSQSTEPSEPSSDPHPEDQVL